MKVNGYMLRASIKETTLKLGVLKTLFKKSGMGFDGENKNPAGAYLDFIRCSNKLAMLQALQQAYNSLVTIPDFSIDGCTNVTLAFAVKAVGNYGAAAKIWESLASPVDERSYHDSPSTVRSADKVYAHTTVTAETAVQAASAAVLKASEIRSKIAEFNSTFIELDVPDGLL